tara:strand:- start:148 stop:597 length:450 start_codon:yes stop_codon:yes gene_type:complete
MNNNTLKDFLNKQKFYTVKLHFVPSKHYKILAKINGVKGWFIIDTGASTTFASQLTIEKFKLKIRPQIMKAQGAGPEQIEVQISKNNQLSIGRWVSKKCDIASIDLSPVNSAFSAANLVEVDGIIGADILKKGKAVIDYDKNYLYLKRI